MKNLVRGSIEMRREPRSVALLVLLAFASACGANVDSNDRDQQGVVLADQAVAEQDAVAEQNEDACLGPGEPAPAPPPMDTDGDGYPYGGGDGFTICGEGPAFGTPGPEHYSFPIMNRRLRQEPEFRKLTGLECVASCEDARVWVQTDRDLQGYPR
ncbi:MAG: hypothetical protein RJA70_3890 [Pseudomonadota bacterium]|jgi:hypothetical protein